MPRKCNGKIYKKRKFFILTQLQNDIKVLTEKARFIQMILDKKIIIEKKKKKEIEEQLEKNNFIRIDNNYDYLLGMNLWSLTEEKIKELQNKIKDLQKQYKTLEKTPEKQLWLEELKDLRKNIEKIQK